MMSRVHDLLMISTVAANTAIIILTMKSTLTAVKKIHEFFFKNIAQLLIRRLAKIS